MISILYDCVFAANSLCFEEIDCRELIKMVTAIIETKIPKGKRYNRMKCFIEDANIMKMNSVLYAASFKSV